MGWQHFFKHLIGFKIAYFSFDHHVTLTFGIERPLVSWPALDRPPVVGVVTTSGSGRRAPEGVVVVESLGTVLAVMG